MDAKSHWETIYKDNNPDELSWFQPNPAISIELIDSIQIEKNGKMIDIGCGASALIDSLLEQGYNDLSVLDISGAALKKVKERLLEKADRVKWFETDVLNFSSNSTYELWHDRAVFHFLVLPEDREKYLTRLRGNLKVGGHCILATFAIDGPEKCSGLDVVRFDESSMKMTIGDDFSLVKTCNETHKTPWDTEQKFTYFLFKREK